MTDLILAEASAQEPSSAAPDLLIRHLGRPLGSLSWAEAEVGFELSIDFSTRITIVYYYSMLQISFTFPFCTVQFRTKHVACVSACDYSAHVYFDKT